MSNKGEFPEKWRKLTTRRKQALAALCLCTFCSRKGVQHDAVTELIEHLLSVLVCDDLPKWERGGAALRLPGRGDPIPEEIALKLPRGVSCSEFALLISHVVEVGLSTMYGADTEEPLEFLKKTVTLLYANKVPTPELGDSFNFEESSALTETRWGAWGVPVGSEEYSRVIAQYRRISGE
jgi:hypothetical protein